MHQGRLEIQVNLNLPLEAVECVESPEFLHHGQHSLAIKSKAISGESFQDEVTFACSVSVALVLLSLISHIYLWRSKD